MGGWEEGRRTNSRQRRVGRCTRTTARERFLLAFGRPPVVPLQRGSLWWGEPSREPERSRDPTLRSSLHFFCSPTCPAGINHADAKCQPHLPKLKLLVCDSEWALKETQFIPNYVWLILNVSFDISRKPFVWRIYSFFFFFFSRGLASWRDSLNLDSLQLQHLPLTFLRRFVTCCWPQRRHKWHSSPPWAGKSSCCVCYVLTTNNFSASNAVIGELLCQQMAKWDLTTVMGICNSMITLSVNDLRFELRYRVIVRVHHTKTHKHTQKRKSFFYCTTSELQ